MINESINYDAITLQDCLENYSYKGIRVIIENGKIIGFDKGDF